MSRPLHVLGAGAALAAVLGAVIVAGFVQQQGLLVLLASWALGSAILLVQLDTWRRTRSLRRYVRDQVRAASTAPLDRPASVPEALPQAPTAAPEDVIGAVRLLQAQYTGRLDRLQRSVEQALADLPSRTDGGPQER